MGVLTRTQPQTAFLIDLIFIVSAMSNIAVNQYRLRASANALCLIDGANLQIIVRGFYKWVTSIIVLGYTLFTLEYTNGVHFMKRYHF